MLLLGFLGGIFCCFFFFKSIIFENADGKLSKERGDRMSRAADVAGSFC